MKFVESVIEESERYAGIKHPEVANEELPTDNWISRTGEGPGHHGEYAGMSYSYGGRQTVGQFNKIAGGGVVRNCQPASSSIEKRVVISQSGVNAKRCNSCHSISAGDEDKKFRVINVAKDTTVDSSYEGNVENNTCGFTGDQNYPGLYLGEFNARENDYYTYDLKNGTVIGQTQIFPQFNPAYWAGIDCSGLPSNCIIAAKNEFEDLYGLHVNVSGWGLSTSTFQDENVEYLVPMSNASKNQKWLRRGDMIHYGNKHMTIMHDNKPLCTQENKSTTKCTYKIIQAYGGRCTAYNKDKTCKPDTFARKVLITNEKFIGFPKTTRFGRIKLWD